VAHPVKQVNFCIVRSSTPPLSWGDHILRGSIVGAGVITLALLAWGHLGLGAWLIPPAPTAPKQVTVAGPYQVTLLVTSGSLTARGPNAIAFQIGGQSGRPLTSKVDLTLQATMTSMTMQATALPVTGTRDGGYIARPVFGMAGDWRLILSISRPETAVERSTFIVSVRWT
jgi:hypothetical protein